MGDFDRCIHCQGTGSIFTCVDCPRCNGSCEEGKPEPPEKSKVYLVCRGSQEEGADIRQIPKAFRRREDAVAYIEGLPLEQTCRDVWYPWAYDKDREWWENQATYEYIIIEEMDVE